MRLNRHITFNINYKSEGFTGVKGHNRFEDTELIVDAAGHVNT